MADLPTSSETRRELDVRPLLARGEDPLAVIEAVLASLPPGGVLMLSAPFRPVPLLERLARQGHRAHDRRIGPDHVQVEIVVGGAASAAVQPRPIASTAGAGLPMEGLRTDQAPPLLIPASFFLLAPVAMLTTGVLFATHGGAVIAFRQLPLALAGTHVGTLGFLGALMMGALYQMIPVVAGAPVPGARIAHGVHAAWLAGAVALVIGFATGTPAIFRAAEGLVAVAVLLFLGPVAVALVRAPTRSDTVTGMRLSVAGFAVLVTLGMIMADSRTTGRLLGGGNWISWAAAHAGLGGLVWVGGLITAVSWQVIPMFHLTAAAPAWSRRAILLAVAVALVGAPAALLWGAEPDTVALAAAPAAIGVWLVHPIVTGLAIRRRRRRRADASLAFWIAGLACAPLTLGLAVATTIFEHPRWAVALGFVALWGWAGLIAHGMVNRIVPFLVWFHRFAPRVAEQPVPSLRQILPEARVRVALLLHVTAVLVGAIAIATGLGALVRATGVLLGATALVFGRNLVAALAYRR